MLQVTIAQEMTRPIYRFIALYAYGADKLTTHATNVISDRMRHQKKEGSGVLNIDE
jgi:hypothetical protein